MKAGVILAACLLLASFGTAQVQLWSFETCPPGVLVSCSPPGGAWSNNGGTNTIVPFGPIAGPQSGFPSEGSKWCIVNSATASGAFNQPAGGPALLPYAPGTSGQINIPTYVPIPGPGQTVRVFFDYTYVSPECPNDGTYNDCFSVDLTNGGTSVLNLLYLDTFSAQMTAPALSQNAAGTIPTGFCANPGTREAAAPGTMKRVSVVVPAALYGTNPAFEVNVADGGDGSFNSYAYIDNIRICVAPTVSISQPGPAGSPVFVDNSCLEAGQEYYNIVSFDLCPGGPGTGPLGGMCFNDLNFLFLQLSLPIGVQPFHFIATGTSQSHGPISLGGPFTVDIVAVQMTPSVQIGPVFRGGGL